MSSILPIKKDTYDMLKAELFLATPKAAGANADAEATKSKATAAENFMVIYSILKMVPMSGVEWSGGCANPRNLLTTGTNKRRPRRRPHDGFAATKFFSDLLGGMDGRRRHVIERAIHVLASLLVFPSFLHPSSSKWQNLDLAVAITSTHYSTRILLQPTRGKLFDSIHGSLLQIKL